MKTAIRVLAVSFLVIASLHFLVSFAGLTAAAIFCAAGIGALVGWWIGTQRHSAPSSNANTGASIGENISVDELLDESDELGTLSVQRAAAELTSEIGTIFLDDPADHRATVREQPEHTRAYVSALRSSHAAFTKLCRHLGDDPDEVDRRFSALEMAARTRDLETLRTEARTLVDECYLEGFRLTREEANTSDRDRRLKTQEYRLKLAAVKVALAYQLGLLGKE